jgi:hypothetical protein
VGYTRDASQIAYDQTEVPVNTLPVCVELLAPKRMLEQFISDQARHLKNTTLVMVDGVHIAERFLQEVEKPLGNTRRSVEYIRGKDGKTELAVDLVAAHEDEDEEAVG